MEKVRLEASEMLSPRTRLIVAALVGFSCGEKSDRVPADESEAIARKEISKFPIGEHERGLDSQSVAHRKQVHDVFAMGDYRVDLISKKGNCYAEVYSDADPSYGPSLSIPLEMKAPCFVRRRVLRFPVKSRSKAHPGDSPLGGAYVYRHGKASAQTLVTVLIGEPLSFTNLDAISLPVSLRCGQSWLYLSVQNEVFRVSSPKRAEPGVCALKVYPGSMHAWGFDRSYRSDKSFPLPPKVGGKIILDDG